MELLDGPRLGRRDLHRRLVALERQQRIFALHDVARLHQHLDDRHVLEVADVGNAHVDRAHEADSFARRQRTSWRTSSRTSARRRVKRAADGAVDHAVIVGKRERQHQARLEFLSVPNGAHRRADDTEDRDLGRVDDRREAGAADAAEARDRERRALHVGRRDLPLAHALRDRAELLAELEDALAVDVLDDGNDEAVWRVDGDADVVVALEDERVLLRRERRVELGELLQRDDRCLHEKGKHRHPVAFLLGGAVELLAIGLELGDVGLVGVGDVRNVEPRAVQVRAREPSEPREGLRFDRAELREVLRRGWPESPRPPPPGPPRRSRRALRPPW